jgi:VWFA-related protein
MRTPCAIVLLALAAAGQTPVEVPEGTVKFTSNTNLVIVDVAVKDKSGNVLDNLKKEDFVVFEDGKPQKISVFEFQKIAGDVLPPAAPSVLPPDLLVKQPKPGDIPALLPPGARIPTPEEIANLAPKVAPIDAAAQNAIASASPGRIKYPDRRLITMFFDFSSMGEDDQIRVQEAAMKYLNEQMTSADMVAIMSFSSGFKVNLDFTNDRSKIIDVINTFKIGQMTDLGLGETGDDTNGNDTGTTYVSDDTEFNIFNTDRKLAAVETASKMLAQLPEKKVMVYFTGGMNKTGVENQAQLDSTINSAVRANVALYPIDARGLVASAPGGDARAGTPRGTSIFSGSLQRSLHSTLLDSQETLYTLAADTGGKAFIDDNDLSLGVVEAQSAITSYYVIGYYSTNQAEDGKWRKIKVSLKESSTAKVEHRAGYFASKHFKNFTKSDKESQLQEALLLGDPVTDLQVALEIDFFRITATTYFVPVSIKIPGSELSLAHHRANEATEIDVIGNLRDIQGHTVGTVRDTIKVKFGEESVAQLAKRRLQYDTGFTLAPGAYVGKFLVRENGGGKMGTFETKFVVPDLSKETSGLRLSSVIWANQREPLASAVGMAEKQKKYMELHPLIQDGQKLVPSITRVFRKNQNLYVYLELYDPQPDFSNNTPSITANLTFFRGKRKAFESAPVQLSGVYPNRYATLPIQFQVPLQNLAPGDYVCQLNIVDQVGRKFAFPRSRIVVLPAESAPAVGAPDGPNAPAPAKPAATAALRQ